MERMETIPKASKWLKYGVLGFVISLVFTIAYTAYRAKKADTKTEDVKILVDSLEDKIDSRYYSYDNLFGSRNSIVVDSTGKKIGEVFILTDDEEIEAFYSDSTRQKTKYYYNLKERLVKVKDKEK